MTFVIALTIPFSAHAAISCTDVQNATAFSPYVRLVLQRAQDAQSRIESSISSNVSLIFGSWIHKALSAVASLVDARTSILEATRSLKDVTACQHLDTLLIRCAIEDARSSLFAQLERQSVAGMMRAQALIHYLEERLLALHTGALDGTYLDQTALRTFLFDSPDLSYGRPGDRLDASCGDGRTQIGEECDDANVTDGDGCSGTCLSEMCPYSSDYAPFIPSLGLGCAPELFMEGNTGRLTATTSIEVEVQTVDSLLRLRNELIGTEHDTALRAVAGCVRGWCEDDPSRSCARSADCRGNACVYGQRICEKDPVTLCTTDDRCGEKGPCVFRTEVFAKTTQRGAFSLNADADRIIGRFLRIRGNEPRAWPDDLRMPEEYPVEDRTAEQRRERTRTLLRGTKEGARRELKAFQTERGRMEAAAFAQSLDGELRITEELRPLRENIGKLGQLARSRDGLRLAARNLAYYLRRSCIHRPCGPLLDWVIARTFADSCYPYTNGEYLEEPDVIERCLAEVAGE